jgi:uncharacterized tellurite resistance protein B-like protein
VLKSLQAWLGLADATPASEPAPLGAIVQALDRFDPSRAQYLARFAYLLGRVAHADEHISDDETRAMEIILADHGGLPSEQAMLVVSLAKSSSSLFGTSADFRVTQDFTDSTSYEERLAVAHCLFAVAVADERISMSEEAEVHRIANQLRIERPDLTALRMQHRRFLPGMSG